MFHIGTYCLAPYARTEKHIRELAQCGIDTVFSFPAQDRATLDLFQKYGVRAVVTGVVPGWWGGHGENAGTLAQTHPLCEYENAPFLPHPAICGIDLGDEPSLLDFAHYGKIIEVLKKRFPHLLLYLNLYPNYAVLATNTKEEIRAQLGGRYAEHLAEYCGQCALPYLSFDHYPYSSNKEAYFENLTAVSAVCSDKGLDMYIVLQVNSHDESKTITSNMLRFQAFTALAYGARAVTWACYTAGWWHHQVLDENGNKTAQYDRLSTVNRELRFLAEKVQERAWKRTVFAQSAPLSFGAFTDVRASSLLAGEYEGALLLCPTDDFSDEHETESAVTFRCEGCVRLFADNAETVLAPDKNGVYRIKTRSSHGYLLVAEQ